MRMRVEVYLKLDAGLGKLNGKYSPGRPCKMLVDARALAYFGVYIIDFSFI